MTEAPVGARRSSRLVPALLLALLAVGVVVLVATAGGGGGAEERQAADPPAETSEAAPQEEQAAEPEPEPGSGAESGTPAPAPSREPGPARAVRAFYERAAADDFDGAWERAGGDLRAAWGGSVDAMAADLGSLRSITFDRLEVAQRAGGTASVAVATRAQHADYTDVCTGTIPAVREGGTWRMGRPQVSCRRQ